MSHWYTQALLDEPFELSPAVMRAAFPSCSQPDEWQAALSHHLALRGMDDPKTMALFLAHLGHESANLNRLVENLNYSTKALLKVFGRHRITEAEAERYGRNSQHSADQEALANILYGGEWGLKNLGNQVWGDGWKHRGQGPIQLTGRANHLRCGEAIQVDLVNDPSLLSRDVEVGVLSALWFYTSRVTKRDVKGSTRQVNGGYNGLADRQARFQRIMRVVEDSV